jgi:transcriptional regulator with XRE-family HTH domain
VKPADTLADDSAADASGLSVRIGAEIRARRKTRHLTMQELAAAAGLSQSFLSQVERGLARLSMRSLDRVAQALDTSAVGLLSMRPATRDVDRRVRVVSRSESAHLPMADHLAAAEGFAVTDGDRHLRAVEFVGGPTEFEPHFFVHRNEEMCFVIEGEFEFEVEGRFYRLGQSDSISYAGGVGHRYRVLGGNPARLLVTVIHEDVAVDDSAIAGLDTQP